MRAFAGRDPRAAGGGTVATPQVPESRGEYLPAGVRVPMESLYGHDFSRVRVHADASAARSASALGALAYTVGTDVVFGTGQYAPETRRGRALLAHELAHVVQQDGITAAADRPLEVTAESSATERAAHAAMHAVMTPHRSPASAVRDRLRATRPAAPTIQRAVSTWGGEFDTTTYKLLALPGYDGVDIALEFRPNDKVDAELIGMVQTVVRTEKGVPFVSGTASEKAAYTSRAIPAGTAGEGRRIDQAAEPGSTNPLYAADVAGAKDRLATTATAATWGHHGWRFTDKTGTLRTKNALLLDTPKLSSARTESAQRFETTALAVQGVQEGTYYGSVSWGWEKDAAGIVTMLPLTRVSKDAPSNIFTAAARRWNASTTSSGRATINLPLVTRGYAVADDTIVVAHPTTPSTEVGRVLKNTRMEVIDRARTEPFNSGVAVPWWKVTVVDGPLVGKVGWVRSSDTATDQVP